MTPLKQAREQAGKTLKQVAAEVEIDVSHLSRIERCIDQASPSLAEKLADFFKRSITEEHILYPERFVKRRQSKSQVARIAAQQGS